MTIEQFRCPHCKASVTAEIVRGTIHTLATEGNTVEAIQIPLACRECGTAMILSVTPQVSVQDVVAVRIVPGDPGKYQAAERVNQATEKTK